MFVKTPPMGYNTWNTFGPNISDSLIRETADAMVSTGLLDAGYQYLVIDDYWSERQRDPVTDKIIPDHVKFPHGMKSLSDYVHGKGLKFGMYSCAGVRTCGDYPGSFDHEYLDAETFAEYGVDFLKYDFCHLPHFNNSPLYYQRIGMALNSVGRDILLSACNWGNDDTGKWIRATGASMYRSTGDIADNFVSFRNIAMSQVPNFCYNAPGCFNDMDMLTIGMYGKGNVAAGGCNDTEYQTQFALWCLFGSPLMIGCDVRNMNQATYDILTNKELIRIDQDPDARGIIDCGGSPWDTANRKVFLRHLSGNEYAIGMFNLADNDGDVCFYTYDAGLVVRSGYAFTMKEVLTGEENGPVKDYYCASIPSHGCKIFRAKVEKI